MAVGADAVVDADAPNATALGQNARVQSGAANSVAVGSNSVASESDTVSVGAAGSERRITNVADGINATDAATVRQLQATYSDFQSDFNAVNNRIDELDDRVDDVGSLASAFSALVPNPSASGKTQISLGMGHYNGSSALAAGIFHNLKDSILVNAAISTSFSSNETAGRAGVTFSF